MFTMTTIPTADSVPVQYDRGRLMSAPRQNSRGEWTVEGVIAREGLLTYQTPTGAHTQLVTRETLENSTDVVGAALVYMHPGEDETPGRLVNLDTKRKLAIGRVTSTRIDIDDDGRVVQVAEFLIDTAEGVAALKAGDIRELSPGYVPTLDFRAGTAEGIGRYDIRQTGRAMNHIAALPAGTARGGRRCRVQLDAKDARTMRHLLMIAAALAVPPVNTDGNDEDNAADLTSQIVKACADLKASAEAANGQATAYKAQLDAQAVELQAANDRLSAIQAEAERQPLLDHAAQCGVDVVENMDNDAIKRAIVGAVLPALNLDGMTDAEFGGVWVAAQAIDRKPSTPNAPAVVDISKVQTDSTTTGGRYAGFIPASAKKEA